MTIDSVNDLKKIFFTAYNGFADKRIKKLEKGKYFIVDDRRGEDYDGKRQLFLWFCEIGLRVVDKDTVTLILGGQVPESPNVKKWIDEMNPRESTFGMEINIEKGQQREISKLATAFRAITKPGARYTVRSYKYVCPRTAKSLDKLVQVLGEAWTN